MIKHKIIEKKLKLKALGVKKMPNFKFCKEVFESYPTANVYLVGGWVRDAILNKKSKDFDLVVNKIEFSDLIDILLKYGKVVFDLDPKADLTQLITEKRNELLQKGFGVIKFFPKNSKECIDIALPRTDLHQDSEIKVAGVKRNVFTQADPRMDIEDDLGRRDFTVNAIALNLKNGELIDPYDGVRDILNKKLEAIGDPERRILHEDLSRAFRALRFMVQLDFQIEDKTRDAVESAFSPADLSALEIYEQESKEILDKLISKEKQIRDDFSLSINQNLPKVFQIFYDARNNLAKTAVSVEIITEEFFKSFEIDPFKTLEIWDRFGALKIILPEVIAMKGTPQSKVVHSEGDVYEHTMLVLKNVLQNEKKPSLNLKLLALLHDIGKVETIEYKSTDREIIQFLKHDIVGAKMARKIFKRLNVASKIAEPIVWAIENHLVAVYAKQNGISNLTLEKCFYADKEKGEFLKKFIKYDEMSAIPKGKRKSNMIYFKGIVDELNKISQLEDKHGNLPESLIDGNDLLELGIKAGEKIGETLEKAREHQLSGELKNKIEAINWVKQSK